MAKKFQQLPRLVQVILLLIPFVNWVTEVVVRISAVFETPSFRNILGLIISIVFGLIWGWLDIIWVLLFKHLVLCKA